MKDRISGPSVGMTLIEGNIGSITSTSGNMDEHGKGTFTAVNVTGPGAKMAVDLSRAGLKGGAGAWAAKAELSWGSRSEVSVDEMGNAQWYESRVKGGAIAGVKMEASASKRSAKASAGLLSGEVQVRTKKSAPARLEDALEMRDRTIEKQIREIYRTPPPNIHGIYHPHQLRARKHLIDNLRKEQDAIRSGKTRQGPVIFPISQP